MGLRVVAAGGTQAGLPPSAGGRSLEEGAMGQPQRRQAWLLPAPFLGRPRFPRSQSQTTTGQCGGKESPQ